MLIKSALDAPIYKRCTKGSAQKDAVEPEVEAIARCVHENYSAAAGAKGLSHSHSDRLLLVGFARLYTLFLPLGGAPLERIYI